MYALIERRKVSSLLCRGVAKGKLYSQKKSPLWWADIRSVRTLSISKLEHHTNGVEESSNYLRLGLVI